MIEDTILRALKQQLACTKISGRQYISQGKSTQTLKYATDQGHFFVKISDNPSLEMYEGETKSLKAIDGTATLRVPQSYYYGRAIPGLMSRAIR